MIAFLRPRFYVTSGTMALLLLAMGFTPAAVVRADQFTASWLEPNTGLWQQDGVWSTSAFPQNGRAIPGAGGQPVPGPNPTYDVVIGNPPLHARHLCAGQTVNVLEGATLNLGTNGYLWANTGFGNAGLITLNGRPISPVSCGEAVTRRLSRVARFS